jgi:hypothetical protein
MSKQKLQTESATQTDQAAPQPSKSQVSSMLNWLMAGGSFAVLAGMIYWGMQLVERDPSLVPVIKAMEGPARTAPENPGGEIAGHLGLAVNKIQTGTGVSDEAESVTLAPEQHFLTKDEQAAELSKLTPTLRPKPTSLRVIDKDQPKEPAPEVAALNEIAPADPPEIVDATEDEIKAAIEEAMKLANLGLDEIPSMIPKLRPNNLKGIPKDKIAKPTVASPTTPSTDPAFANRVSEVEVGSKVVQLGAYDSEELALAEWKKLMGKHSDFLAQKKLLVQPVDSGGRQLFRLRAAGFDGRDEAKGFCTALSARGVDCFALTAR